MLKRTVEYPNVYLQCRSRLGSAVTFRRGRNAPDIPDRPVSACSTLPRDPSLGARRRREHALNRNVTLAGN